MLIWHLVSPSMEVKASVLVAILLLAAPVEGLWCVARSDAADATLQAALDYACSAGADCAPMQPTGLCFLPNTLQAHASYAFNSFYQRKNMAPGACDFAGSATLAKTDPSYGSCVYPPNPRTAGLVIPRTNSSTAPFSTTTTTDGGGGGGGLTPNFGPPIPTTTGSLAPNPLPFRPVALIVFSFLLPSF